MRRILVEIPKVPTPAFSPAFLTDEHFFDRITQITPTLAHVVDLTRGAAGSLIQVTTEAGTAKLQAHIQDWRDARETDKRAVEKELNAKFPKRPFDPERPMRYVYNGLARLTITDGFNLDDNHMRDLYHACAAVRCAEPSPPSATATVIDRPTLADTAMGG